MNDEDLKRLEENFIMHGFKPDNLPELRSKIKSGEERFQVTQQGLIRNTAYEANAYFRHPQGKEKDMVYFNNITMTIPSTDGIGEAFSQTIAIGYKKDYTLTELFNLMNGRNVSKEMLDEKEQLHRPWVGMNLEKTDSYGNHPIEVVKAEGEYHLISELEKLPIRNFEFPDVKRMIVDSIERGNQHETTIEVGHKYEPFSISADPRGGSLRIWDSKGQPIDPMTLQKGAHQGQTDKSHLGKDGQTNHSVRR